LESFVHLFNRINRRLKREVELGIYLIVGFPGETRDDVLKMKRKIQSLIVEGGAYTLIQFLKNDLWDEARIFKGSQPFYQGLKAPEIHSEPDRVESILDNQLYTYYNKV
jgi:radical SAM superfamily enzyme YgiQ (UPF0313 family)